MLYHSTKILTENKHLGPKQSVDLKNISTKGQVNECYDISQYIKYNKVMSDKSKFMTSRKLYLLKRWLF